MTSASIEYRIFGPPGTGKTRKLSNEIKRAALKRDPTKLLVMSFTKAGAVEIAGRELPVPDEHVGTMHKVCYHALGRPKLVGETLDEFNKVFPDFAIKGDSFDPDDLGSERAIESRGDDLLQKLDSLRARVIPAEFWPYPVREFAQKWEDWKDKTATVDFTDMIQRALNDFGAAPNDPEVIFMDEVQDSTALELKLLRQWGAQTERVVIAGDDDQAIYGFRGATPEAFLKPELPIEQIITLKQSYRLPRAIQNYTERWVHQISYRQQKEYAARDEEGSVEFSAAKLRSGDSADARLLDAIENDLARGKRIMVLASCGYMLAPFIEELRCLGIPFCNHYRTKRADWNPLLRRSNSTSAAERLLAYIRPDSSRLGEHAHSWTWQDVAHFIDPIAAEHLGERGTKKALHDKKHETTTADFAELAKLLPEEFLLRALDGDVPYYLERLLSKKQRAFAYPATVLQRFGASALIEQPKLVVGTIHSVKGGEVDVVYLAPDTSLAADNEYNFSTAEARDAVLRTFYVGMTRAKEKLVLLTRSYGCAVAWGV